MRRGYWRGLVIGGILGLAVGKMLRYKENITSDNDSTTDRFHKDKEFPTLNDNSLDNGFNEKEYEDYFEQYNDDEIDTNQTSKRKKPARAINKRKRMGSLDE